MCEYKTEFTILLTLIYLLKQIYYKHYAVIEIHFDFKNFAHDFIRIKRL